MCPLAESQAPTDHILFSQSIYGLGTGISSSIRLFLDYITVYRAVDEDRESDPSESV